MTTTHSLSHSIKNRLSYRLFFALSLLMLPLLAVSQNTKEHPKQNLSRPKLVVGIVIDQMRYDYLYRFYEKYGDGGFKRMFREGFNCRNNHYHYGNTSTGAGHASIYTGSAPALHGILGNDWYVPELNKKVNCVEDTTVIGVGAKDPASGNQSPKNLISFESLTISDQKQ